MTHDSEWNRIRSALADVLEQPHSQRFRALVDACGDDELLLSTVARLVAEEDDGEFLQPPDASLVRSIIEEARNANRPGG